LLSVDNTTTPAGKAEGTILVMREARSMLLIFCVALVSVLPAAGQSLSLNNKTIIYKAVEGSVSGYIYISSGGSIFWGAECDNCGFGAKNKGVRLRLGKSFSETNSGCRSDTSAALSGNVMTLRSTSSCPALQSTDIQLVTIDISGDSCNLSQSTRFSSPQTGNTSSSIRSESCRIVTGNKIAN